VGEFQRVDASPILLMETCCKCRVRTDRQVHASLNSVLKFLAETQKAEVEVEVEVEVETNPRRWVSCPVAELSSNASQSLDGI
jgi:hypothetical protein